MHYKITSNLYFFDLSYKACQLALRISSTIPIRFLMPNGPKTVLDNVLLHNTDISFHII